MKSITGKPSKFDDFVEKLKKESPIHISKRMDSPKWFPLVVRVVAIIAAFLVCAIVAEMFKKGSFSVFFEQMFNGTFGSPRKTVNLFEDVAILLIIALAVTPAFKMRFWNIGAEGQVLMGALMSAVCIKYLGGTIPDGVLIIIMLIASILGGAAWTTIPAIFKAKFNTNETLFTLMMNYIAMGLISFVITVWVKNGSGVVGTMRYGQFPRLGELPYLINIIVVAIITVLVYIYLRFSKHGYELSVVGESINTAKYVGISVPKVIIRTMILSGALCGIAGWLLVGGASHTITTSLAGGRGFTAILVSWLAHFNPIAMIITSFLVAFISKGASQVSSIAHIGGTFPDIITAIFFFVIIASEFVVSYKVKFNFSHFKKHDDGANASEDNSSSDNADDASIEDADTSQQDDVAHENTNNIEQVGDNLNQSEIKEVTE